MASITYRGREVRNPLLRVLLSILVPLFAFVVLVIFVPASIPFHFVTKLFNGRGFMEGTTYHVPPWCMVLIALLIVFLVVIL